MVTKMNSKTEKIQEALASVANRVAITNATSQADPTKESARILQQEGDNRRMVESILALRAWK